MNTRDAQIVKADKAFKKIIQQVGPAPNRRAEPASTRFATLVRTITHQLLATKAAETIHQRLVDHLDNEITPENILQVGVKQIQACGLNRVKAQAMMELSQQTREGLITFAQHGRMSNTDVKNQLMRVRGIGPWTAQMYLMSSLARKNVWPAGDFGVRNGWSLIHNLDEIISIDDLSRHESRFPDCQSAVAWYCWRAIDLHRAG
jgi:DNA-3-methyladenine glycosylase II